MPFHIADPETDRIVRELARLTGRSLTDTVRQAARAELERLHRSVPLTERLARLSQEIRSHGTTGQRADKAFFDSLSGDP